MVCDTGMILSGIHLMPLKCGETSIAVARFNEIEGQSLLLSSVQFYPQGLEGELPTIQAGQGIQAFLSVKVDAATKGIGITSTDRMSTLGWKALRKAGLLIQLLRSVATTVRVDQNSPPSFHGRMS